MDAEEIINEVRRKLDDTVEPYLWSDADLMVSLNNAVDEVCIRTRCIQDTTSAARTIALVAGTARYALNPAIFAVIRARVAGQRDLLDLVNAHYLDERYPGWDDATLAQTGTPRYAVFDDGDTSIRVFPVPDADVDLDMTVWRRPLDSERIADVSDEPACPIRFHGELKHHVLFESYSDTDTEKNNPERAAKHYALFENNVGQRPSAHHLRLMSTAQIRGTKAHFR